MSNVKSNIIVLENVKLKIGKCFWCIIDFLRDSHFFNCDEKAKKIKMGAKSHKIKTLIKPFIFLKS